MNLRSFQKAPYHLDARALDWMQRTFAGLSPRGKLTQLITVVCLEPDADGFDALCELGVGGVFRMTDRPVNVLRREAARLQAGCAVPLLLSGDLEFSERAVIGGPEGTMFPNQMAVAATRDPLWAGRMARVAAREGLAAGYNWSFTPIVDINANFRSALVNTRSFGDETDRIASLGRAYIKAMQAEGMAACAKHWPGDGLDDRDQHFVTTVNPWDFSRWDATFGRVYRTMIRAGVLSVMSAHIALPACRGAGYVPASLSRVLNLGLLRGRFRFNGLIVSDASVMAGLSSQGPRMDLVPRLIENGCDMLLFPGDAELDVSYLERALSSGRLSQSRVDQAVLRVLALKAAVGLHRSGARLPRNLGKARRTEHLGWARECARRTVTLVKDEQHILPLSPRQHPRVLLIQQPDRKSVLGPLPDLQLGRLLTQAGFRVEMFDGHTEVHRDFHDVLVYAVGMEGDVMRPPIHLPWVELHRGLRRGMERYWHTVPTIFISFGSPYHQREVPACPTFINAYSPALPVQEAVVLALTGRIPFAGSSPVDLSGLFRSSAETKPVVPFK